MTNKKEEALKKSLTKRIKEHLSELNYVQLKHVYGITLQAYVESKLKHLDIQREKNDQ